MITVWWTVAKLSHSWGEKHIALDSKEFRLFITWISGLSKMPLRIQGWCSWSCKDLRYFSENITWCSWPKRVQILPKYQKLWCWSTHFWRVKIIISTIVLLFYYILKYWGYECIYSPALYNFYVEKYRGTIHTKYTPLSSRHKRIS